MLSRWRKSQALLQQQENQIRELPGELSSSLCQPPAAFPTLRVGSGARDEEWCRSDWTTVTLATVTCNSCLTIVGFIVAGAKEAKSKMKQRTMVSDTSSTTHFNHSWQKLIQEEFLQRPPMQHVLLLLLLLPLFWPKIFFLMFRIFFPLINSC